MVKVKDGVPSGGAHGHSVGDSDSETWALSQMAP